ncbi:MAG: lipoyl synthase [Chloroflexi bacterium]|nr:lipoyl synthase [Chloroflexota bacterium]
MKAQERPKGPVIVQRRLPEWFKVRAPGSPEYIRLQRIMAEGSLHTVCEEARCPSIGDCWGRGTATFMILGDVCTRACRYCAVRSGNPGGQVDSWEPLRVAQAVKSMGLRHAVVTSVDRDDLPDGGAGLFAQTVHAIRQGAPGCTVEVLIPDFQGDEKALQTVLDARPEILNHNIETVPRIFRTVRARGSYWQSLDLLDRAKRAGLRTKSGMMVGLGETKEEVLATMDDLRSVECDILTVGQYLRPSSWHHPLDRYYTPQEFSELRNEGLQRGFRHVQSGPLVRSSYHAEEQVRDLVS